jgi:dinuclear metal center YbgI/SA1388 family protein
VLTLRQIAAELDELLDANAFDDYCPNGLQVAGRDPVRRIVTGVSAQRELFERAIESDADVVLVHHGIFWRGDEMRIDGPLRARLLPLLVNDIGLLAYHLPLDAHPEVGNNALIADGLGAGGRGPFAAHRGRSIGVQAAFPEAIAADDLVERVNRLTAREPLVFAHGPAQVQTVAIVSGAGTSYLDDAIAAGVDAFITGEPAERAMALARDAGIHFIAAGHYATETFGVRALGDRLAAAHGVEHLFVDLPNPV